MSEESNSNPPKEKANFDQKSDLSSDKIAEALNTLTNDNDASIDRFKEYRPFIEINDIIVDELIIQANQIKLKITKDIDLPSFRIIAGKLEPVRKLYNIRLPSEIDFSISSRPLYLLLKIPTDVGDYEIINNPDHLFKKIGASLIIESYEGVSILYALSQVHTKITYATGWISILLRFAARIYSIPSNNGILTKICNMQYAIDFEPFDLLNKNVSCHSKPLYDKLEYKAEACLFFGNPSLI